MNIKKLFKGLKKWIINDKKIIVVALSIGFIVAIGYTSYNTKAYSETIHQGLEQNLIRFHVIANSDSEKDQSLKLKVRDAVLEEMKPILDKAENVEESKKMILDNKEKIKSTAKKVIKENGEKYDVSVQLEQANFPTKKYGDIVLPAGEYEALRIVIGEGNGKNWWCVMFPPLCFVDITHGTVPDETKEELKNVLTEEEYRVISNAKSEDIVPVKIKFKIVEWWQENKNIETIFAHINRIGE